MRTIIFTASIFAFSFCKSRGSSSLENVRINDNSPDSRFTVEFSGDKASKTMCMRRCVPDVSTGQYCKNEGTDQNDFRFTEKDALALLEEKWPTKKWVVEDGVLNTLEQAIKDEEASDPSSELLKTLKNEIKPNLEKKVAFINAVYDRSLIGPNSDKTYRADKELMNKFWSKLGAANDKSEQNTLEGYKKFFKVGETYSFASGVKFERGPLTIDGVVYLEIVKTIFQRDNMNPFEVSAISNISSTPRTLPQVWIELKGNRGTIMILGNPRVSPDKVFIRGGASPSTPQDACKFD